MRRLILIGALLCATGSQAATDLDALLKEVQESQRASAQINSEREQRFLRNKAEQQQMLEAARAELRPVEARVAALRKQFTENELELSRLKETLAKRAGDLNQLTALVRQAAGDLRAVADNSMISAQFPLRTAFLDDLAQTESLPDIEILEKLWIDLQREMTETGKVVTFTGRVMAVDGTTTEQPITRIGPFTAVSRGAYLNYLPLTFEFQILPKQPEGGAEAMAEELEAATEGWWPMVIDPTRGSILALLEQQPTMFDRIKQGGWVGAAIILLGIAGLLFAAYQLFFLERVAGRVKTQLGNLTSPSSDNPLGRVLAVYRGAVAEQGIDVESLELQLDEAILKETPQLERGQGLLKLLAAVAPLMGLLGTVVGMIATFQAITLFGTGDPKLMAGGISQALVTTVLGLIAAIPLLFAHSVVSARSRGLVQILDEQAAGLLASRLESEQGHV